MDIGISRSLVGFVLAALLSTAASAEAPRYRELDLGTVVSGQANPTAIDNQGIAAFIDVVNGQFVSVLLDVESGQVVGRIPGDRINALSDSGNEAGAGPEGAFAIVDGVRTRVPLANARGVNDAGQVAGFAGGFFPRAALVDARTGAFTDLGTLGGRQSVALAINGRGQVTGLSNPAGTQAFHAFRWTRGTMEDLGTLGGDNSFGDAIDDEGRVAGVADTGTGTANAFLADRDGMHDLGGLPGCGHTEATSIGRERAIAGFATQCAANVDRAFLFDGTALRDLNELADPSPDGFIYARATGINRDGIVVGIARSPDGFSFRPFVLVPADD